jgi:hypothetical protein
MSLKVPAVPSPAGMDGATMRWASPISQILMWITGQNQKAPPLTALPQTASLTDVINAHNALVQRIQGQG